MENKEYTPGQNRPGRRGGMRGPGMGRGPAEKASDFKGTWSESDFVLQKLSSGCDHCTYLRGRRHGFDASWTR